MYYMVVIVMAMIHMNSEGTTQKDLFVYYKPYFYSIDECKNYINNNLGKYHYDMAKVFPEDKIEKIYCIPNSKVSQIMKDHPNG